LSTEDTYKPAARGLSHDDTMKASEVHKMSDEELNVEEQSLRMRLYELRSQAVTEKLENPRQMPNLRRDIARLLTERNLRNKQQKVSI